MLFPAELLELSDIWETPGGGQSVSKTASKKFIYGKNRGAVKKENKNTPFWEEIEKQLQTNEPFLIFPPYLSKTIAEENSQHSE